MNQSLRWISGLMAMVTAVMLVNTTLHRYERQEIPRNSTPIVIFDQGYYKAQEETDRWALPGWDRGLNQQRSLATAGCHLIAYAHCIQWVTGTPRGDVLLEELLQVCRNPSDQGENNHDTACRGLHDPNLYSKDAYDAYLLSQYNIRTVEVEKTPEDLTAFFDQGGAIVTFIPGHYISAVEIRAVEGEYYVHIIDSNWGTARRKEYDMFFLDEEDQLIRIFHTADGTYTDGSDYWVPYSLFEEFVWKTPILPPGK